MRVHGQVNLLAEIRTLTLLNHQSPRGLVSCSETFGVSANSGFLHKHRRAVNACGRQLDGAKSRFHLQFFAPVEAVVSCVQLQCNELVTNPFGCRTKAGEGRETFWRLFPNQACLNGVLTIFKRIPSSSLGQGGPPTVFGFPRSPIAVPQTPFLTIPKCP